MKIFVKGSFVKRRGRRQNKKIEMDLFYDKYCREKTFKHKQTLRSRMPEHFNRNEVYYSLISN